MEKRDIAILYSGGRDSLSLYALSMTGRHKDIPMARSIHCLHMLNGMGRFHDFPKRRLDVAKKILEGQVPQREDCPSTHYVELDCGRLFQGLWLDTYEALMPRFGGKNLVCVACKLAMHTKAIIYSITNYCSIILAGYAKRQSFYPEQTHVFMEKIVELSAHFGVTTNFPLYEDFSDEDITRHLLEDFGLPSTGGGERKCLFCQTLTTATEKEIGQYLDYMIPTIKKYIDYVLSGQIKKAAECFPPGNKCLTQKSLA